MTLAQLYIGGYFDPNYFDENYFECGTQINLRIYGIMEKQLTRTIIHELLGVDRDYVQTLGKKYRRFTIKGWLVGSGRASIRTSLRAGINDVATFTSEGIPSLTVFIENINFRERGIRPLEYDTEIDCIEVLSQ